MAEAIEKDSPNRNADLDDMNQEQLVSIVGALRLETERKGKHIDELNSTIEAQSRTITEQSETLMNREQVVADLTANNENFVALLKAKENEVAPAEVGDMVLAELIAAVEQYGVNCARVADRKEHNAVAVTFMQVANHLRRFDNWQQAIDWLNGRLPTS